MFKVKINWGNVIVTL